VADADDNCPEVANQDQADADKDGQGDACDEAAPIDTTPPTIISTVLTGNATGVAPTANVTATFSEDMLASSITSNTFKLFKKGSTTKLGATVSYDADTDTATLDPTNSLRSRVT
jgi:hypothetical protein